MSVFESFLFALLSVAFFALLLASDGRLMEGQSFVGFIFVFFGSFMVARFFLKESSKKNPGKKDK